MLLEIVLIRNPWEEIDKGLFFLLWVMRQLYA